MAIKDYWKPILGVVLAVLIIVAIVVPITLNSNSEEAIGGSTKELLGELYNFLKDISIF